MKNPLVFSFFIILILGNAFYSCAPDDEDNTNSQTLELNENLTGTWYFKDAIIDGRVFPYPDHEDCGKDYISFAEDGTFMQVDIWNCEENIDASGTYTADNETIIVKYSESDIQTIKIINLTEQTLSLESNYDYNDNGEEEAVQQRFSRE